MDVSRVALSRARAEMIMRNLRSVNLLQVDVDTGTLEPGHYDVICVYDYLKRHLFPQICAAVKPGGRVIYSSLNLGYLREVPDFNHDFLLEPGELERVFEDWKTILYNEGEFRTQTVVVKPRRQPAKP
jgi:SAM-dependent methyltransferase